MYRFYRYKTTRPYYDKNKIFYVCSAGGCGSQILCHYLGHFGDVYHIHSRTPPNKLTNTGYTDNKTYAEWFSDQIIPDEQIKQYHVIFMYRDPVDTIYSRFDGENHLKNIQCPDPNVNIELCVSEKKDVFALEQFFDNYTTKSSRNYLIYCLKYEEFWSHMSEFNMLFRLPDIRVLYPERKETLKPKPHAKILKDIYKPLIDKMSNMKWLEIR